jgi:methylthioribulose-1-phosphate dehydratase
MPAISPENPLQNLEAEIDSLRDVGKLFFERSWSVGTSSNYSVVVDRDPLRVLITSSGKDKGNLSREEFVVVDETGQAIGVNPQKPSAETLLHCVAAQQPEVGAVLHTHSVWGTLLSDLFGDEGGFEIHGYEMLKGLSGVPTHEYHAWVQIFENTQRIPILAKQVREQMSNVDRPLKHGYLIRKHGLYTWGADVAEARRHIEIFEFLFECVARDIMLKAAASKK